MNNKNNKKEWTMNKVTKLGVSALCGSLAAVSAANAGDMTVTGGVDMSWISLDDQTTGNPIGMGSNLTFAGSGELDNGWSFALSVAIGNQDAYSNTNVTVTVPDLGAFRIDQGVSATGLDRIDDVTPNVWEEAWGTGVGTGINTVNGVSASSNIEYTPNMLPDGLTAVFSYSPDVGGNTANDLASSAGAASNPKEGGYDITLTATDAITGMEGLTLYAGYSAFDRTSAEGDAEDTTIYATYAIGGFTFGYQWSEADLGTTTGAQQYDNDGYGITFAINDDLSIGYNHYESKQTNTANVTSEATSMQIAYSAGGLSLRLAAGEGDNMAYQTGAAYDRDSTVLSVALAF
jgi:outer membrane protein OmpU